MRIKLSYMLLPLVLCIGLFSCRTFAYVDSGVNADAEEAEETVIEILSSNSTTAEMESIEAGTAETEKTVSVTISEDGTYTYSYGGYEWTVRSTETENGWYQVTVPEMTGYVYSGYLEVSEDADSADSTVEISDTETVLMRLTKMMQMMSQSDMIPRGQA